MKLSRKMRALLQVTALGAGCLAFSAHAFADNCTTLNNNADWNDGMTQLSSQMKTKQWDDAYKTAENLNAICDRSPQLNYAMGIINKEKGDDTKALYYMQRATRFTEEFAVKGDTLEKMWNGRYEAEHPEARPDEIAKRQEELEKQKALIEALTTENLKLKGDVKAASLSGKLETFEEDEAERMHYAAGLWTGVAFTGVGLVLAGVGGGLYVQNYKDNKLIDWPEKQGEKPSISSTGIYLGMLGAGIGLTVLGSIFTGVFGYHYANKKNNSNVSFNISPLGTNMKMIF